jgi:hypothetical protein
MFLVRICGFDLDCAKFLLGMVVFTNFLAAYTGNGQNKRALAQELGKYNCK